MTHSSAPWTSVHWFWERAVRNHETQLAEPSKESKAHACISRPCSCFTAFVMGCAKFYAISSLHCLILVQRVYIAAKSCLLRKLQLHLFVLWHYFLLHSTHVIKVDTWLYWCWDSGEIVALTWSTFIKAWLHKAFVLDSEFKTAVLNSWTGKPAHLLWIC